MDGVSCVYVDTCAHSFFHRICQLEDSLLTNLVRHLYVAVPYAESANQSPRDPGCLHTRFVYLISVLGNDEYQAIPRVNSDFQLLLKKLEVLGTVVWNSHMPPLAGPECWLLLLDIRAG